MLLRGRRRYPRYALYLHVEPISFFRLDAYRLRVSVRCSNIPLTPPVLGRPEKRDWIEARSVHSGVCLYVSLFFTSTVCSTPERSKITGETGVRIYHSAYIRYL